MDFDSGDIIFNDWNNHGLVFLFIACGDCGRTTQKGYVEILEFTHFVEFFSFNRIAENHKEKELVRKVTVVVALASVVGTQRILNMKVNRELSDMLIERRDT